jgi:hypothetical protein
MHELLTAFRAKREELGTQALADALDISDSAVRMVCTEHYPNPKAILEKFARQYIDIVHCPYAERVIERDDCTNRSTATRPFGGASKQSWWDACQTCEHRGER